MGQILYIRANIIHVNLQQSKYSLPGADSAGLHRTCVGTEDGGETESGVYGRSAQGGEKRHFLTIRK